MSRFALILFVLLVFGFALVVPAEDVLETTYDESETQPYQEAPVFAVAMQRAAARANQEVLSSSQLQVGAISLLAAHVRDAIDNRSSNARVSPVLLGTLRC